MNPISFNGTLNRVFEKGTFIDINKDGEMYDRPVSSVVDLYMKPKEFESIDRFVKEQLPQQDEVKLYLGRKGVLFLQNTYINDYTGHCPKDDTGLFVKYYATEKNHEDPGTYVIEGFISFSEIFRPYAIKSWLKRAKNLADKEFTKVDHDQTTSTTEGWMQKLKNLIIK